MGDRELSGSSVCVRACVRPRPSQNGPRLWCQPTLKIGAAPYNKRYTRSTSRLVGSPTIGPRLRSKVQFARDCDGLFGWSRFMVSHCAARSVIPAMKSAFRHTITLTPRTFMKSNLSTYSTLRPGHRTLDHGCCLLGTGAKRPSQPGIKVQAGNFESTIRNLSSLT